MSPLKVKRISLKNNSDEINNPGDCYIVDRLEISGSDNGYKALIILCPYCGLAMSTIKLHKITEKKNIITRFLIRLGFPHGITVSPVLQCPYQPTHHKFFIRKGRILTAK